MAAPSLPNIGSFGQQMLDEIQKSLQPHDMKLSYDSSKRVFTILNSARYNREEIQRFLREGISHVAYVPILLGLDASSRDHVFNLRPSSLDSASLADALAPV